MPRIVFVEPRTENSHIFSMIRLPRIGSFLLATIMKNRGWQTSVVIEDFADAKVDDLIGSDIVAISTITPTTPRAYALADQLQAKGIPVIMGGPHVTFLPDEALLHADFVIRGEGEQALSSFIDVWEDNRDFSKVPNLSYKVDGQPVHNPSVDTVQNLDALPYPDFSLAVGGYKCKVSGKVTIPVQTSRGCPFDCSFCSVTAMFGHGYRFRSTEHVMQELRQYDKKENFIFFNDDNFTHHRSRAKELLRAMIKHRFKFQWSTQVRADIAKDIELVKLMKQAGCHTVFIGFESVNPESLKAANKKQTVEDIKNSISIINKNHIHIHGMFVYGFDSDNFETIKETIDFVKQSGITSVQFLVLTPFPGTHTFKALDDENRIKLHDWGLYDAHHVVFQPKHFSALELQNSQIASHTQLYSVPQIMKKLLSGNIVGTALGFYARKTNIVWQKQNTSYIKTLDNLSTSEASV